LSGGPVDGQSLGVQLGDGTQSNYVKLVVTGDGGGTVTVVEEVGDDAQTIASAPLALPLPAPAAVDLWLAVDRRAHTVQASYAPLSSGAPSGTRTPLGPVFAIPSSWTDNPSTGLAVGIISTSAGPAPVFPATWDFFKIEADSAVS